MTWLLDTNVVSEVARGPACNPRVATWVLQTREEELFVSVLVLGELRKGIEQVRRRDAAKANVFQVRFEEVVDAFAGRVIPVDEAIADEWGCLNAIRSLPVIDSLLVATARVRKLTLVTRDHKQLHGLGVRVLDPFT